jgi:NAD(P)H-hydrate epimerase
VRTLPPGLGVRVLTADDSRAMDRRCADEFGLPTLLLMENAGARVAEVALGMLARAGRVGRGAGRSTGRGGVLVVCGTGGNGGDGLVAARRLDGAGVPVAVVLSGEPRAGSDAAAQLAVVLAAGLHVMRVGALGDGAEAVHAGARALAMRGAHPTVIIDALLGSGLRGPARAPVDGMIGAINALRQSGGRGARGTRVLAVDVPSGMDSDATEPAGRAAGAPADVGVGVGVGESAGPVVRADVTLALVGLKPALLTRVGRRQAGRLVVADIGVPRVLREAFGRPVRMSPARGAG